MPAQPGSISGPTPVCQNTINNYNISPVSGATSYTWTLPSGWTGSSNTTSINATAGVNGGIIKVKANNACGSGPEQTKSVTVNSLPAQPGPISGPSTVDEGTINTYAINAVPGAVSYTWTLPAGWSGNSNTTSMVATAGSSGGNIKVKANNTCGSGPEQVMSVSVNATVPANISVQNVTIGNGNNECYDAIQVITVAGVGTTFAVQNGGDATFIAGQKIRFLPGTNVSLGGHLHGYITTNNNYCGSLQSAIVSNPPLTEEPDKLETVFTSSGFKIYPNPTNGRFTLLLDEPVGETACYFQVIGMLGNMIINERLEGSDQFEFDLTGQNRGMFVVRLIRGVEVETGKIIKD